MHPSNTASTHSEATQPDSSLSGAAKGPEVQLPAQPKAHEPLSLGFVDMPPENAEVSARTVLSLTGCTSPLN